MGKSHDLKGSLIQHLQKDRVANTFSVMSGEGCKPFVVTLNFLLDSPGTSAAFQQNLPFDNRCRHVSVLQVFVESCHAGPRPDYDIFPGPLLVTVEACWPSNGNLYANLPRRVQRGTSAALIDQMVKYESAYGVTLFAKPRVG